MTAMTAMSAPFPTVPGGYQLIVADPPWTFATWSAKGQGRSASRHYPCMPTLAIAALPVSSIAAKDSNLLLWTTWPHLLDAAAVLAAWGFAYSTGLPWIKRERDGKPVRIMGYYWRHSTEVLLLGKRRGGRALPRRTRGLPGLLDTPKTGIHSRKPREFYAYVDSLFGADVRRIELFARAPHPAGWSVWGHDADPAQRLTLQGVA